MISSYVMWHVLSLSPRERPDHNAVLPPIPNFILAPDGLNRHYPTLLTTEQQRLPMAGYSSGQRGQTVNLFLEAKTTPGGVLKWTTRIDCKSIGYAFEGSNPSPATIL